MRLLLVALACVALLAGCERTADLKSDGWMVVQDGQGSAGVREITLPSGLRCAVLIGYSKGALDCDFPK